MAIDKERDDPRNATLRAKFARGFKADDGRGFGAVFKDELNNRTKSFQEEPLAAILLPLVLSMPVFFGGALISKGVYTVNNINYRQDTAIELLDSAEDTTGFMGFEYNGKPYAMERTGDEFLIYEPNVTGKGVEIILQDDPAAALDTVRHLLVGLNAERDSLDTNAPNSDLSVVQFDELSVLHADLDFDTLERTVGDGHAPQDGLGYRDRLNIAISQLEMSVDGIANAPYAQNLPEVEAQPQSDDILRLAVTFPLLFCGLIWGYAPATSGVSAARQTSPFRRKSKPATPK